MGYRLQVSLQGSHLHVRVGVPCRFQFFRGSLEMRATWLVELESRGWTRLSAVIDLILPSGVYLGTGGTSFPGGLTPPALSKASLAAAEPDWLDFFIDSFDVEGVEPEEVLPAAPFLSLSRETEWERERWVWVCEVLRCLLSWETLNSMASSVEEAWLLAFPCPDRFGSALATNLLRALSSADVDSRVTETVRSFVFFPVTAEELGVVVAAVVVVATA